MASRLSGKSWILAPALAVAVVGPRTAYAQVGLTSSVTQVALVARVAPRASIEEVRPPETGGRLGSLTEVSVTVVVSANTSYRLMVRGTPTRPDGARRMWVRTPPGEFQEVTAGGAIVVARGGRAAGRWRQEVTFRIESAAEGDTIDFPVRYEILVDPSL